MTYEEFVKKNRDDAAAAAAAAGQAERARICPPYGLLSPASFSGFVQSHPAAPSWPPIPAPEGDRTDAWAWLAASGPRPIPEGDPRGLDPHSPGAKLDAGKIRPAMVLGGFARALIEVSKVGTRGAVKYSDHGWLHVPNGQARYDDAKLRHWLYEARGDAVDPGTGLVHAAHEAWNALARLELLLRAREDQHHE